MTASQRVFALVQWTTVAAMAACGNTGAGAPADVNVGEADAGAGADAANEAKVGDQTMEMASGDATGGPDASADTGSATIPPGYCGVGGTSGVPMPSADFFPAFYEAYCARMVECFPIWFGEWQGAIDACAAQPSQLPWAEGRGNGYDSSKAGLCLQAIRKQACAKILGKHPPVCQATFRGKGAAPGSPCAVANDCESGWCNEALAGSCGECSELPRAKGQNCDINVQCACDLSCLSGVCALAQSAGDGDPCLDDDHCKLGSICEIQGFGVPSVCSPKSKLGEPCSENGHCEGSLACLRGAQDGGKCRAPSGVGAPCGDILEKGCKPGLVCATLYDKATSVKKTKCLPVKNLGDACESGFQCGGATAACIDGTCAIKSGVGGKCSGGWMSECMDGLTCVAGTCTKTLGKLGSCSAALGAECLSKLPCVAGKCAELVCK